MQEALIKKEKLTICGQSSSAENRKTGNKTILDPQEINKIEKLVNPYLLFTKKNSGIFLTIFTCSKRLNWEKVQFPAGYAVYYVIKTNYENSSVYFASGKAKNGSNF